MRNIGGDMIKWLVICALCLANAYAHLDLSVLKVDNSWLYKRSFESGSVVPMPIFKGFTHVKIDSISANSDSLVFFISHRDSGIYFPDTIAKVRQYKKRYRIVNDSIKRTSEYIDVIDSEEIPMPMWGLQLADTLNYSFYNGKYGYLNSWNSGPIVSKKGRYLEGVGLISAYNTVFGGMTREYHTINLIKYNDSNFDSTKIVVLGKVLSARRKINGGVSQRHSNTIRFNGAAYELNGRQKPTLLDKISN